MTPWLRAWTLWAVTRLRRDLRGPANQIALLTLGLLVTLSLFGASLADLPVDVALLHAPPSWSHPLGTDRLGRDVLSRLLAASAWSLPSGLLAVSVGLLIGVPLAVAQVQGGATARAAGVLSSSVNATPALVIAMLAASVTGGGLPVVAVALGLASAPTVADTLQRPLQALHARGLPETLRRHGLSPLSVTWVHGVAVSGHRALLRAGLDLLRAFLIAEATLSWLGGFGVQEPASSWGNMMAGGWGHLDGNPLVWLAPMCALAAVLAALMRLSGSLHDLG